MLTYTKVSPLLYLLNIAFLNSFIFLLYSSIHPQWSISFQGQGESDRAKFANCLLSILRFIQIVGIKIMCLGSNL